MAYTHLYFTTELEAIVVSCCAIFFFTHQLIYIILILLYSFVFGSITFIIFNSAVKNNAL